MSRREEDPPVDDIESEEESSEEESSDEDTPEEPATPLVTNQTLPDVTNQLDNLHLDMGDNQRGRNPTPAPTADRVAVSNGSFKVNPPSEFSGQRNQVKTFKLQSLTYLHLNNDKLNTDRKRLLFLTSYLRGPAYEWILPHLDDYLKYPNESGQKATTRSILADPATFFQELQIAFGYESEKMEAERALQSIQQRGPVSKYKAEFQTLVVKTSWDDQAITSHFYRGLKNVIKDEIARRDSRPTTFQEMYEVALKIDERIYERQMEKKGVYQGRANTKVQREVPAWKDNYYGLQKMQIDATQGKPGSNKGPKKGQNKRPQPKTKGTTDKSNVECYGCGKKGHYKNECNARKQRHDLQGSGPSNKEREFRATKSDENAKVSDETKVESIRATQGHGAYDTTGTKAMNEQDSHAALTWTACFEDGCTIHYGDKYGSGYWPQYKTRSVCRTMGQPSQGVRYPAGYPPQEESTEEEEESSDEEGEVSETESVEEPTGSTEFNRILYSNDPMLRLLEAVADSRSLVLPWDSEGQTQMVDESELWELFTKMMRVLWNISHSKNSIDYHRIVQEFPPLGSRFTPRGGYFTTDNICITRTMRMRVMEVKNEYATERHEQNDGISQQEKATVEIREVVRPNDEGPRFEGYFEGKPLVARHQPMVRQNRPPTPYDEVRSVWEPPLNTSDPNFVPRRPISMQQGLHAPQASQNSLGAGAERHSASRGTRRTS
jgi:hypothetical protein